MALALLATLSGLGFRSPWARPLARHLARGALKFSGLSVSVRGLERLPPGPHILLVNHSSFLDPIVLTAALPADPGYAFVTRQQYGWQAILWPLLHSLGTVVLKRRTGSYTANVQEMSKLLASGGRLVVFPEGRFRSAPGLLPFHSGVFLAAATTGAAIVPAALRGTRAALPLGAWCPVRIPIALEIGRAMLPARHRPDASDQLRTVARRIMLALSREPDAGEHAS